MRSYLIPLTLAFVLIVPEVITLTQSESHEITRSGTAVDYLIITNESFVDAFEDLAGYRRLQGYNVKIETVNNITAEENGNDTPEKIRNHLREMHQNGLRYVLLGGSIEYIPPRTVYYYPSKPFATDFYYCSLNESWDADNDSLFGEHDDGEGNVPWQPNINFSFDLAVGRAPVSNVSEVSIFINKTKEFEMRKSIDVADALLIGEFIKGYDEMLSDLSDGAAELERYFPPQFPPGYNLTRIYRPDCMNVLSATLDVLNTRTPYFVTNLGHGNEDIILGKSTSLLINSLLENASAKPFIWLSLSCLVANLSYPQPTAVQLIRSRYGPAAFIGNSEEGELGETKYMCKFLEGAYSKNISTVGKALLYAKQSIIEEILSSPYPTVGTIGGFIFDYILLGDPALRILGQDFPVPKIVFTSPREGENLTSGASIEVKWRCENLTENSVMDFGYYDDNFVLTWVKGIDPMVGYYKCKLPDGVSSTYFEAFVVNTSRQRLNSTCVSPTFLLDQSSPSLSNFDYYYDSDYLFLNITSDELLNISSLVEGILIVDGLNYSGFDMLSAEAVPVGYYSVNGRYLLKSLENVNPLHNCTVYFLSSIKDCSYPGNCLNGVFYYVQNTSNVESLLPQFLNQSGIQVSNGIRFQLSLSNDNNVSSVSLVYRDKSINNWSYTSVTKAEQYECTIVCLNDSSIKYFYLVDYDDKMLIIDNNGIPFEIVFIPNESILTQHFQVEDETPVILNEFSLGFLLSIIGIILIIVACVLVLKSRSKRSNGNRTRENKK